MMAVRSLHLGSLDWRVLSGCIAEFMASFTITILQAMASISLKKAQYLPSVMNSAVLITLIYVALLLVFLPFGGVFNPVTNMAYFLDGRVSFIRALLYSTAEICGGAIGGVLSLFLRPDDVMVKTLSPGEGMDVTRVFMVEVVLTAFLIFVVLSIEDERIRKVDTEHASLAIGFTVGAVSLAGGSVSGGVVNPMSALGITIASEDFTYLWVYWAGPYLGGLLGLGASSLLTYSSIQADMEEDADITMDDLEEVSSMSSTKQMLNYGSLDSGYDCRENES